MALHVRAGVRTLGVDLEPLLARVLQGRAHEGAGDAAAFERRIDLGVNDRHEPRVQLVFDAPLVPIESHFEAPARRLMLDLRFHAESVGQFGRPQKADAGDADQARSLPDPAMRLHFLPLALLLVVASACDAQEIQVHVQRDGESVIVDVDAHMPGTLPDVWAVFTDYENMASFISNLTASKVLAKKNDTLEVMQSGQTKVGFMTFGFAAVRAVELVPMKEIRSRLVSGDFKAYVSTTSMAAASGGTRVRHHGEYVPKSWLPPLIGPAVIERETHKQYQEFAAEVERRRSAPRR